MHGLTLACDLDDGGCGGIAMVGFFDSGVGGRCILDAFLRLRPDEPTVYVADGENCPYGNRAPAEIVNLSKRIAADLIERGCEVVVVACNTATAAAIDHLRSEWPDTPFVGMEPAVKPAALESRSGVVGVLATRGTFNGRLYKETSAKVSGDVRIIESVADEFVDLVERGVLSGDEAEIAVRNRLEPLLDAGADRIVLGCTHFPHLKPLMERVVDGRAVIVDPSEAVARRIVDVLEEVRACASRL